MTAAHAPAVAQLCIHLDGIPLALELAAARVRSLSIEQINARLNDRFKLLTGGPHGTAPPADAARHARLELRAASEHERVVLRRLAVFPGGFTLEAAAAVASDETIDESAVIDLLSQLVARSLVVADTNDAGARYRLLETTRAYALEKLAEAGETDAIKRRHAAFAIVRARARRLAAHVGCGMARHLLPERDNVRAALDWALGADGDPTSASRWPAPPRRYGWSCRFLARVGIDRGCRRASGLPYVEIGPGSPVALVGVAPEVQRAGAGGVALERAIDLYRRLAEAAGLGHSLSRLARCWRTGRFDVRAFRGSIPSGGTAGLPKVLGFYFSGLG